MQFGALESLAVTFAVLVVIGTATNSLIIFTIARSKRLHNTCHILIAACACSDILHLLGQILEIVQTLAGLGRISSKTCCLAQIIPSFGLSAGTILVLLIAIDRLLSVYMPMFYSTKTTWRYLMLHVMAIIAYAMVQYACAYAYFVERQVFCNTPAMYQGKSSDLWGITSLSAFLLAIIVYYAVWQKLRNTAILISERRLFRSIFSIMGVIIVGWLLTMSIFAVLKNTFDMEGDMEIILTQIAGIPANITFSLNCPVLYLSNNEFRIAFKQQMRALPCIKRVFPTKNKLHLSLETEMSTKF